MIKENIFSLKNGKYENRLFFQFVLLVTIPLILMGVITYSIYINGETKRQRLTLDSYCETIYNEYNNIFSSIKEYYMNASSNENIKWLVSQTAPPYTRVSDTVQAQNVLRGNYFMLKYIDGFNFINVKNGWVLNNNGMFYYNMLRNKEEVDAFLVEQKEIPLSVYWLNRVDVEPSCPDSVKPSRIVDTTMSQFILKSKGLSGEILYMIMVQLNQKELERIAENYNHLGYEITVLSDGKLLTQTNQGFTDVYFSGVEKSKGGDYSEHGNKNYYVSVMESPLKELTCVVGYDLAKTRRDGAVFVLASLAFAAFLAVFIIIIRQVSIAFAKPVISLQRLVDSQTIQIKELFVSNVIKGELVEERIKETLERIGVSPFPCYRVIGMIYKPSGEQRLPEEETRDKLYANVMKGLPEDIKTQLFIAPAIHNGVMLFIIGAEEEIALDNKTASVYKQAKDFIEEESGYMVASGVSRSFTNLKHLRRAYNECSEVLHNKHNLDEGYSSLVLYDDYSVGGHTRNAYDIIIENELVNAISGCNEEDSKRLLEIILERMERKEVTGIERNFYVVRLLTAILSILDRVSISLGDVFGREQYNIVTQASQIFNRRKLALYIEDEIIHPIIAALTSQNQSGASEIVRQVMKMIKDTKGNITLNECADSLSYHPNYIWKVLKMDKGVTFTELVNNEKLDLAKFMLLTTDYSVADISDKLQYTNVQNFIRFFKSHVGNTPAAFRKEHKH